MTAGYYTFGGKYMYIDHHTKNYFVTSKTPASRAIPIAVDIVFLNI